MLLGGCCAEESCLAWNKAVIRVPKLLLEFLMSGMGRTLSVFSAEERANAPSHVVNADHRKILIGSGGSAQVWKIFSRCLRSHLIHL